MLKHGVEHYVKTQCPLISARARRLPPDKLKLAKEEFDKLETLGIICCSNSQCSSPLHMVPKGSGWRPFSDYHRLNNVTTPNKYPVPHILDFAINLVGMKIFSKIDLVKGYH